jgi:hypothetical protein
MKDGTIREKLRKHEIAQCVTIVKGGGDLPKISVKTGWSTAEGAFPAPDVTVERIGDLLAYELYNLVGHL